MPFRDIVVYLDAGANTADRVQTALGLAKTFGARLIGVDVSTDAAFEGQYSEAALAIQTEFEEGVAGRGVEFEYRVVRPGALEPFFCHCADLLIATQSNPDDRHLCNPAIPQDVMLHSGVPMLVLPAGWRNDKAIGRKVVVAWNFSREATRAVHDAMPILERASEVFLFMFAPNYSDRNNDVQYAKSHLEHHGVKVTLAGWPDHGDSDMTSALFAGLDREEADLIVCGAFGHSPLSESLFGGASKVFLNNVSMPVLMSH